MRPNTALDAAIALSRAPNLAALMRARELPGDVALLLRILAADGEAVQEARKMTGLHPAAILTIAELYVKEVLLFAGAPPRRVLGLSATADRVEARTNLRFLLNWLHPDKNPSKWQSAFATRVIAAWRLINDAQLIPNTSQLTSRSSPAQGQHRLPWIARPVAGATLRSRLRVSRTLFVFCVAVVLVFGLIIPNNAVIAAYQNLITAFFDDDPISNFLPSEISAISEGGRRNDIAP